MASIAAEDAITVLFVHGAWHTPLYFRPIIQELQFKGYSALAPHLPTCDAVALSEDPDMDMTADVKTVENEIRRRVLDEGRKVLLVTHSYGGVVGTEAVAEELGRNLRLAEGKPGGVIGILYVSAFLIAPGTSLEDLNGGNPAPFVDVHVDGSTTTRDSAQHFFNDLEPATQAYCVSNLVSQPRKAHSCRLTRASYRYVPSGYVFCMNDQAIPLFVQEAMVKSAQDTGVRLIEYQIRSGHSPFMSQPMALIDVMLAFVKVVDSNNYA